MIWPNYPHQQQDQAMLVVETVQWDLALAMDQNGLKVAAFIQQFQDPHLPLPVRFIKKINCRKKYQIIIMN